MNPEEKGQDKSHIDQLKEALYSRTAPDVRTRRKMRYEDRESDVKTSWDRPKEEVPEDRKSTRLNSSHSAKSRMPSSA